ncbi:MAG: PleD family two-component system response regulator [Cyanophyceae cyanobacterium]
MKLQIKTKRLLIVEDDPSLSRVLSFLLVRDDLEITTTPSVFSAINLCQFQQPDLIVLDLSLIDGEGYQVIEWLQSNAKEPFPSIIIYTARDITTSELIQFQPIVDHIFTKSRIDPCDFQQTVFGLLDKTNLVA